MADDVNIRIRVTKTGTGATEAVNDLKGIHTQAGSTVAGVKSAFGSLNAAFGMVGIGVGAASIVKFGLDTITAASDASEAVNKMQVVFGNASSTITSFASTAARDLGLSKTQAIDAAGTFGNLFTSMGLGQSASADMSRSLVQLAADLGSFNNIPIDVMLEKLRSGMVGEVEPLRAVGINLSAVEVKAKAMAMGLADANGEVSQAATLQARYAVMLEQSTNAQGDFARTSDGLANSIKTANAEMADLKVQLGELTIKPYTIAVRTAVTGLGNLNALLKTTSNDDAERLEGLQAQLAARKKEIASMEAATGKGILGGLFNQKYSPEQIEQAKAGTAELERQIAYLASTLQAAGDVGAGAAQVNIVPELQAVTQTVAGTGSTAHSDAEGVINAVNGVSVAVSQIKIPPPQIIQVAPTTPVVPTTTKGILGGYASGTAAAPGGLALVGERGPELVNLPRGSQVYTAAQTASMMGLPAFASGTGATTPSVKNQIDQLDNAGVKAAARIATSAANAVTALEWAMAAEKRVSIMQAMQTGTNPGSPLGPVNTAGISPLSLLNIQKNKSTDVSDQTFEDQQERRRIAGIQLTQSVAERALSAIQAKWQAFASTVTSALDSASNKAKGLFDLGGGGGAGGVITEPGKGGPFEALYRITDIAATMAGRAPGADTAKWQEMYAGQDAMGIARNFQQGNLLAPGVFENIDWGMLGQQATQQQESSKISSYAGQAVANLTKAGKPLTAEAVKAEIDKLAEKDKASLVPELQNVAKTVTDTGATAHTDAGDVVLRLDSVISALNKPAPAPVTPPAGGTTTPPTSKGPPKQTIPLFAAGTAAAPGGMAIVGERGPELVNLPQGARVYTASQTDNILAGLALRGFAAGTSYAPGGMAILGERGPELVQIPGNRQGGGSSGGGSETQVAAQFMTELAKAINTKASTTQQAADALADMLVNAAAVNVQTSMLRQLSRR